MLLRRPRLRQAGSPREALVAALHGGAQHGVGEAARAAVQVAIEVEDRHLVRYGAVWCRCGAVWCGMVQCGAVWCGQVRCGSMQSLRNEMDEGLE